MSDSRVRLQTVGGCGEFFGPVSKLAQLVDLNLDGISVLVNLSLTPYFATQHILQACTQFYCGCQSQPCCEDRITGSNFLEVAPA